MSRGYEDVGGNDSVGESEGAVAEPDVETNVSFGIGVGSPGNPKASPCPKVSGVVDGVPVGSVLVAPPLGGRSVGLLSWFVQDVAIKNIKLPAKITLRRPDRKCGVRAVSIVAHSFEV